MVNIPDYICDMTDEEFLESLDEYGDYWVYCHEAAKRIRRLKADLAQPEDSADRYDPVCSKCGDALITKELLYDSFKAITKK